MVKLRRLDKCLAHWFSVYAGYVERFWYVFLVAPILLTGICSVGFMFLPQRRQGKYEMTEYVFTPNNGDHVYERAAASEHWPLNPNAYLPGKSADVERWIEVLIVSKNKIDMLSNEKIINEALSFGDHILENLTISGPAGFSLRYSDLCMKWEGECFTNVHLTLLKQRNSFQKYFTMTYPVANQNVGPIYVANLIGGVTINQNNGSIIGIEGVRMLFALLQSPDFINKLSIQWTLALQHYVESYRGELIDVAIFHAASLDNGLEENAVALIPKFSITVMLLVSFAVLCSHTTMAVKGTSFRLIDWHKSRPLLAIGGVVSAGLGIAGGMGFLLLIGTPYNPVVAVMPFLVISIGIDDMFIIMSTWRSTSSHQPVRERLCEAMREAGVSITITTATDVLSFGIGTITNFPGVQIFCIYTGVALWFTYLMQMTLFLALMVLSGRREAQGRHCLWLVPVAQPDACDGNLLKQAFMVGSFIEKQPLPASAAESNSTSSSEGSIQEHDDNIGAETNATTCFALHYVPMLLHPIGKTVTLVIALLYLCFAIWGITHLSEGLEPKHLLLKTHHAVKWYDYAEQLFFPEGLDCQIIVHNVPENLSQTSVREDLLEMVSAFEDTEYTMKSNATMFWMRYYLRYLENMGFNISDPQEIDVEEIWSERLQYWVSRASGTPFWKLDLKFNDTSSGLIEAFRFTIGLRNFVMPNDHKEAAVLVRSIAARYPQYNITTWQAYWPFADQYLQIRSNTFQDIGIGVVCMMAICALLIPSLLTGILIVLAIISIDVGVIGFMTWWNVNLDAISMITLIMSMGFAVDQTAHVSYGYISSRGTAAERTVQALNGLGWPMLQGSFSAILGVLALATVDAYTVVTFFKTVLLAMSFGCIHGVVFLPVLLATFVGNRRIALCKRLKAAKIGDIIGCSAKLPGSLATDKGTEHCQSEEIANKPRHVTIIGISDIETEEGNDRTKPIITSIDDHSASAAATADENARSPAKCSVLQRHKSIA